MPILPPAQARKTLSQAVGLPPPLNGLPQVAWAALLAKPASGNTVPVILAIGTPVDGMTYSQYITNAHNAS